MSTKLSKLDEIKARIQALQTKTEDEHLEHDTKMLMAGYLSEIERYSKIAGFNRKELAKLIKTSSSYLTQVFRGDKPLNFYTLAKIQKVLSVRFEVRVKPKEQKAYQLDFVKSQKTQSSRIVKAYTGREIESGVFTATMGGLSSVNSSKKTA